MRHIELVIGALVGLMAFLAIRGYDIVPLFFFLSIAGGAVYLHHNRNGKSFAVSGGMRGKQQLIQFGDIGGQEVAKKELQEALDFIKDAERIAALGIRPLKGILLNGPPGTGKTLLAKAAAQFTNSSFVAASGSEFVEMYVGVGAQRVRQLFKRAKEQARHNGQKSAVVFIDEIEIIGGRRGQQHSNMEYDQTINELLVQMDGIAQNVEEPRILVIGATNRVDILDPALLRPGRFDRQVKVDLPDKRGRLHILELHTRNKPLDKDVLLDQVAHDTFGFSGAHLESVVNEAAILALREDAATICAAHLQAAVEKVMMGEKLDRLPNAAEKFRIAVHEAGHAILSELVQPGSVASVNVVARGNALGYVRQSPQDDMYLYTAEYIRGKIAVALAGAVAEEVALSSRSTGASSDFKQAADLSKQLIFGGMSELGIVSAEDIPQELLHATVTAILKQVEDYVRGVLLERQTALHEAVNVLLNKETLSGQEFRTLVAG